MEWQDIPEPIRSQLEYSLEHPETWVRRERPKRQIDEADPPRKGLISQTEGDRLSTSDSPRSTDVTSGGCR